MLLMLIDYSKLYAINKVTLSIRGGGIAGSTGNGEWCCKIFKSEFISFIIFGEQSSIQSIYDLLAIVSIIEACGVLRW